MKNENIIGLLNEGAPGQDDISSKNVKRIKDSIYLISSYKYSEPML